MKREVIRIRNFAIHLFQVRHTQEIYWYIVPVASVPQNDVSVLEEGQSSSPQLAVQKAREALYIHTGIRE